MLRVKPMPPGSGSRMFAGSSTQPAPPTTPTRAATTTLPGAAFRRGPTGGSGCHARGPGNGGGVPCLAGRRRPVPRIAPHGPGRDPLPSHGSRTGEPCQAAWKGHTPRQAAALTEEGLAAIRATARLPRTGPRDRTERARTARLRGQVDIALVSVMRDAMLRRSEAAALRCVTCVTSGVTRPNRSRRNGLGLPEARDDLTRRDAPQSPEAVAVDPETSHNHTVEGIEGETGAGAGMQERAGRPAGSWSSLTPP